MVAYAEQLRLRAARKTDPGSSHYDPYAKPYAPTTAAARKLCTRIANRLVDELPAAATDEERAQARAHGPVAALEELAWRVASQEREERTQNQRAKRSQQSLQGAQRRASRAREAELRDVSLGQRLDQALAALSIVAAAPGTHFDPKVTGSHDDSSGPRFPGDPQARARAIALDVVRQVEDELDSARRRRVEDYA